MSFSDKPWMGYSNVINDKGVGPMKKVERAYASLRERIRTEWVLYLLAFVFILIADSIGQIKIPVWKGTFIIFPIFYALFLGILTGPNVLKILDDKKVKAASGGRGSAPRPRQGPSAPGPRFGALQVFVEKIPSCDNPAVPAQTISEGGIASTFARYTPKRRDFQ